MTSFDYIVLGAGNAGGYVAKEFVAQGLQGGQLALVTDEEFLPYERPALSKGFLMGQAKLPGFHTAAGVGGEKQDAAWYEAKGIATFTKSKVSNVDVNTRTIQIEGGSTLVANKALIIATGASVIRLTRNPGHDLEGITYLRNIADGNVMLKHLETAKTAVVVGGGYIGLECAAALVNRGLNVTMVFPEKHVMERLFTPEIAAHYEAFYSAKGVKLIKGALCTEFLGENGHVTACKLNNGDVLPAELVVVGVGAIPNVQLFAGQLNMADKPMGGILVDSNLETSAPGVYAIGDVAAFPLLKYNRIQRVEHVTCARLTGMRVVHSILSSDKKSLAPFDYLPHFYSRVFNLNWKFWGDNVGDQVVVGGSLEGTPKLVAVWLAGNKVMGVYLESGSDQEFDLVKAAAAKQPEIDLDALKAAAVQSADAVLALLA